MTDLVSLHREVRPPVGSDLDEHQIHDVLRNHRRRLVIECLREMEDRVPLRTLSERVAERETGERPAPRKVKQSVYVALDQCHLPKLDQLGIVDYESDSKHVTLNDRVREVEVYMEVIPHYGLFRSEFYQALGILALLTVVAAEVGVPVVSAVGTLYWTLLFLCLFAASAVYEAVVEPKSVLNRLTN